MTENTVKMLYYNLDAQMLNYNPLIWLNDYLTFILAKATE